MTQLYLLFMCFFTDWPYNYMIMYNPLYCTCTCLYVCATGIIDPDLHFRTVIHVHYIASVCTLDVGPYQIIVETYHVLQCHEMIRSCDALL